MSAPLPIQQDQEKESAWRRWAGRYLPDSALGAGRLAFGLAALAALAGLTIFLVALRADQARSVTAPADAAPSSLDYDSLNREWVRLRGTLVPDGATVLPNTPVARALMWLALRNQTDTGESMSPLPLTERFALAVMYYHWAGWAWDIPRGGGWDLSLQLTGGSGGGGGDTLVVNECDWFQVECSPSVSSSGDGTMTVTKLNMTGRVNFLLWGGLPTELGLLSNMESFSVANNQLQGAVPDVLGTWTNLRVLELRLNQLTGLGVAYEQWSELESMDISVNQFKGNVSSQSLRRMRNLRSLDVRNNKDLATDESLFIASTNGPYWPYLESIAIALTKFQLDLAYVSADNFPSLQTVDASQAVLLGSVPSSVGLLTSLESLDLSRPYSGRLTGTIPTEIGLLSDNLLFLSLEGNAITGTLPTEIGLLTKLQEFNVFLNSINGTIPTQVGYMQDLKVFDIVQNDITGTIPTELGACTKLQEILLHYTELRGTMPDEVCQLLGAEHDDGFFQLGASCAVTAATAMGQQVICDCCTDCYGA